MSKVKILFYGTCHLHKINELMKENSLYTEKYDDVYIPNFHFRIYDDDYKKDLFGKIISEINQAQIIVYQPVSEKHGQWSTEFLLKCAKETCRLIRFPNVYNTAFFPLCTLGDYLGTKVFGEETVVDLIKDNYSLDKIIELYKTNQLNWNFENRFKYNISLWQKEESKSEIRYCDFILANYKKYQLFEHALYPTMILYVYLCNQLLDILGVAGIREVPFQYEGKTYQQLISTPSYLFYKFEYISDTNLLGDNFYIDYISSIYEKYKNTNIDDLNGKAEYDF